jgi:hypothetical protein
LSPLEGHDRVTVAAPDVALGELFRQLGDAEPLLDHRHDVLALVSARPVVEVEDAQVGDTAVRTRVVAQVGHEERLRLGTTPRGAFDDDPHMTFTIARVVVARRLPVALTAYLLEAVGAGRLAVELGERLFLPA